MTMTSHHLRARTLPLTLMLLIAASGCVRHPEGDEDAPEQREPVVVHVRNENFLDMNVFVVVSGVSRRLGTVSGNSSGDFSVEWGLTVGQSITLTAVPIGGRGSANTGPLSIGLGQVIDFTVAPVLRQSTVSVHEPPLDG
jgi:hypothetical protein